MNNRINKVVALAKDNGLKVGFVGKKLGEYAAMNSEAAKLVGFKGCPKYVLLVDKNRPVYKQERDLKHEIIERHKLLNQNKRQKHMSNRNRYELAHKYAESHQSDSIRNVRKIINGK